MHNFITHACHQTCTGILSGCNANVWPLLKSSLVIPHLPKAFHIRPLQALEGLDNGNEEEKDPTLAKHKTA
eukprot:1145936-Pelagomonas_calceolata.AAC.3